MHIHILGICGTFMGGVAQLAVAAGHRVTGSDANVYPPMSDQLKQAGIALTEGYRVETLALKPDLWVIGNAISRGNPLLEAILNEGLPYTSGPQWMCENILQGRHVLAVAGTHGKTTTTSMLLHILQKSGMKPGYLVGGVPQESGRSAEFGQDPYFVIEADEYDTAFFDKRSKFLHYRPRTVILNNLEFDHADIFENLAAIQKQFHHLVRTIPSQGLIISNGSCQALDEVLAMGCPCRLERFACINGYDVDSNREIKHLNQKVGRLEMPALGQHNAYNALAAILAAVDVGVPMQTAIDAMRTFIGVKRRLEVRGQVAGVTIVDDFAHHPTAIEETLRAVRTNKQTGRIIAVLEPRSNTMKMGTMKDRLADSLRDADLIFGFRGVGVNWDVAQALGPLGAKAQVFTDFEALIEAIVKSAQPGDTVLVMSNGAFGNLCGRLLSRFGE